VFKIRKKTFMIFFVLFIGALFLLQGCAQNVGKKISANTGVQQAQVGDAGISGNIGGGGGAACGCGTGCDTGYECTATDDGREPCVKNGACIPSMGTSNT